MHRRDFFAIAKYLMLHCTIREKCREGFPEIAAEKESPPWPPAEARLRAPSPGAKAYCHGFSRRCTSRACARRNAKSRAIVICSTTMRTGPRTMFLTSAHKSKNAKAGHFRLWLTQNEIILPVCRQL